MPAVTTTVGREVLVADDAVSFASETVRLLEDKSLQRQLAENGRSLAETRYDWQVVLDKMDAVYNLAR